PELVRELLEVEDDGDAAVVHFAAGPLVLTEDVVATLGRPLEAAAAMAGGRTLVLDFGNVRSLSGAALGTLLRLNRKMRAAGGRLALRDVNAELYAVFELTRLTTLLDIDPAGEHCPGV
ncbi:MAG TPA: STAS domain-containing protein, partial [Gemmataceae bacterium]|nr:STAS domain-containing protein [Gemmataceae bacterium]